MALASTNFMTATGIFDSNLDKIDCSDILASIILADTATLGQIGIKGKATNIEHRWIEDKLNAVSFTAKLTASTKLSIVTPATNSSVQVILRTGAIVYPEGKVGEAYYRITTTPVKNSNVVTKYAGTFTAITSTTTFYVVQMPRADISTASSDISRTRTMRKNFTQVFERAIEIAETRQHIDVYAVANELKHQTVNRTHEIKRELNMSVLLGQPNWGDGATVSADYELHTMSGIYNLIRDPNLDLTDEDTTVVNASSASLSVDLLNSLCFTVWDAGGLGDGSQPILIMNGTQKRKFSALDQSYRRDIQDTQRGMVGYHREAFLCELGMEMPVIVDRWMRNDVVILLDKSRCWVTPLQGDQWHMTKMSKTGRTDKWQLSGQYTVEVRNPEEAHGALRALAT